MMPSRRQGESLEHLCFEVLASTIHKTCVKLEETPNKHVESPTKQVESPTKRTIAKTKLMTMMSKLPSLIIELITTRVIEAVQGTVKRNRSTNGLVTCLEVLLQSHIQKLDLSGLFFQMRISGKINEGIREVVGSRISSMTNLVSLNMVSKCSDHILLLLSKHCTQVQEVIVTLSEQVTDVGVVAVSLSCPLLEILNISKCWEVTQAGIATVLTQSKNLKELHTDQLGSVLIESFKHKPKNFKLINFEQMLTVFEPTHKDIEWLGQSCKDLESARLFIKDSSLKMLHNLGKLRTLEIENVTQLGDGFIKAINDIGATLVTLQLNCDAISQEQLTLVGNTCVNLSTLYITTATIDEDQLLINTGKYFPSLKTLYLEVWKEAVLDVACVEFFLLWCRHLRSIVVKARMEFLTDRYLTELLNTNPQRKAQKIIFASDKFVPLTVTSVHAIIASCPILESLGISSWNISEEEYFEIRSFISTNNYNLSIL